MSGRFEIVRFSSQRLLPLFRYTQRARKLLLALPHRVRPPLGTLTSSSCRRHICCRCPCSPYLRSSISSSSYR